MPRQLDKDLAGRFPRVAGSDMPMRILACKFKPVIKITLRPGAYLSMLVWVQCNMDSAPTS